MRHKIINLIILLVVTSIFFVACSNKSTSYDVLEADMAPMEATYGRGLDFTSLPENQDLMDYANEFGLSQTRSGNPDHYTLGDLDSDGSPELIVFKERNMEDISDEGYLEVYKYRGKEYSLLDRVTMYYDNTNYQLVVGNISNDQVGILLNNQVGAHSGMTRGFILEDGKLKNIFDENKISLLSIYPNNEIRDIDYDGILEFSIYTIDPETEETTVVDSDKMTLWYRWDGKDGGILVDFEKERDLKYEASSYSLMMDSSIEESLPIETYTFNDLIEIKYDYSKQDLTSLIEEVINNLGSKIKGKNDEIKSLLLASSPDNKIDYVLQKYGIGVDRFNSIEYLNRDKTLKDEGQLKEVLLENIDQGYFLSKNDDGFFYNIDYKRFLNEFENHITNEYKDYLQIHAIETLEPYLVNGRLVISMDKLVERILLTEAFKMVYPYSSYLEEVLEVNHFYMDTYFYGTYSSPHFDEETLLLKEEIKEEFEKTLEKYTYTNFAQILGGFLDDLEANNYVINDDIGYNLIKRFK